MDKIIKYIYPTFILDGIEYIDDMAEPIETIVEESGVESGVEDLPLIYAPNLEDLEYDKKIEQMEHAERLLNEAPSKDQLIAEAQVLMIPPLKAVAVPMRTTEKERSGKAQAIKGDELAQMHRTNFDHWGWKYAVNIAIKTGPDSGLDCIDVDNKEDTIFDWEMITDKFNLPECPKARTPSGGYHYFFKHNPDIKSRDKTIIFEDKKLHIDYKGQNKTVNVYPSINRITLKKYEWVLHPTDYRKTHDDWPVLPPEYVKLLNQTHKLTEDYELIENNLTDFNKLAIETVDGWFSNPQSAVGRRDSGNTTDSYFFELLDQLGQEEPAQFQHRDPWLKNMTRIFMFVYPDRDEYSKIAGHFSKKYEKNGSYNQVEIDDLYDDLVKRKLDGKNMPGLLSLEDDVRDLNPKAFQEIHDKYYLLPPSTVFNPDDLEIIDNSVPEFKPFDRNDPYCWIDFFNQFNNKIFPDKQAMLDEVIPHLKRVFAVVMYGKGSVIRKEKVSDMFHVFEEKSYSRLRFSYKIQSEKTTKIENIKFQCFLDDYAEYIPRYSNITCKPKTETGKEFNIWSGYQAQEVPELNINLVQPMLDFIREVWCRNDEQFYRYLMSWLHQVIAKPEARTQVTVFAYSREHGTGKNTLTDFLLDYVIGKNAGADFSGLADITKRFNSRMQSKVLAVVNEASSAKDSFRADFNKMKTLITDSTLTIEQKGRETYDVDNLLNFMILSNHADSIHLENDRDRRYFCLEISDKYCQDVEYFGKLRGQCFNQEAGNHFYTYMLRYPISELVSLHRIPKTELKTQTVEVSAPSQIRFLTALNELCEIMKIEGREPADPDSSAPDSGDLRADCSEQKSNPGQLLISGTKLYDRYRTWCERNGERNYSNSTKFGLAIKDKIDKIRTAKGVFYVLDSIKA